MRQFRHDDRATPANAIALILNPQRIVIAIVIVFVEASAPGSDGCGLINYLYLHCY